jgi:phage tail-like protein
MRGLVDGLGTPFPLIGTLPGVYQEDAFAVRMLAAFDLVLAPVVATLDNLDAYVDPDLAPGDFVVWLAGILGFPLGDVWPEERARELVSRAVEIHEWRGTVRGVRLLLAMYLGFEPEVTDSGGTSWTSKRSAALPGSRTPSLVVRIRPRRGQTVSTAVVEALIESVKPVHVPHRLEVGGK